jgi:hypothetical protein
MPLSKQESRERFAQLNALLFEWDPIGVGPDGPTDEYECLAGPLMRLLESRATQPQIVAYLKNELDEHFGLDANNYDIEAVAARVRAWFDRSWASSETERS